MTKMWQFTLSEPWLTFLEQWTRVSRRTIKRKDAEHWKRPPRQSGQTICFRLWLSWRANDHHSNLLRVTTCLLNGSLTRQFVGDILWRRESRPPGLAAGEGDDVSAVECNRLEKHQITPEQVQSPVAVGRSVVSQLTLAGRLAGSRLHRRRCN